MNILLAILGGLICGGVSGGTVFFFSKRASHPGDISDEIAQLQADLDHARSHAFRIQQAQQERNMQAH
jgi:hypothetical protein